MINIRPAKFNDCALILELIKDFAAYENASDKLESNLASLERDLFAEHPKVYALLCEVDGQSAGLAIYYFSYGLWQSQHGLYLEGLYLSPQHRRHGAGFALMKHLAHIALAQKCSHFEWNVSNWNTTSIQFYESLGAQAQHGYTDYQVNGDALIKLASH